MPMPLIFAQAAKMASTKGVTRGANFSSATIMFDAYHRDPVLHHSVSLDTISPKGLYTCKYHAISVPTCFNSIAYYAYIRSPYVFGAMYALIFVIT